MYSDFEQLSHNSIGETYHGFCNDSTGEYYGDNDDIPNLMLW